MKTRIFAHILLLGIVFFLNRAGYAQTSAWDNNSFKLIRDYTTLEDMTSATKVDFDGVYINTSKAISFSNFSFQFGMKTYRELYISTYGFIKLGSPIVSYNAEADSNVIVPLYNGTGWSGARYKLVTSGSDTRLVIEFSGVLQPSGEPTKFQVWLYQRTGKIQFVYQQIRGYYGYRSTDSYRIFCRTTILDAPALASVKINPKNAEPAANYSAIESSFDSIYANTRITFQPDTVKPKLPLSLTFSQVHAGCLTANINENANNESVIMLERADSISNFHKEKVYYTSSPAGSTIYSYDQSQLQPFSNYKYRVYLSNGFLNSDTLTTSVQTLMPEISGIKRIPGDYSSITSLLADAQCRHIGPDLVIELQNNYSFAAETLPITFNSTLQNRFIQSIVIRPAANTLINWTGESSQPLFYVDSVKHVFLDGRPGGTGTTQNLTLFQKSNGFDAIQYTNAADSGGIRYVKVIKKYGNNISYALRVVPLDKGLGKSKKDINAFSVTNCSFTADSSTVTGLIYIKPGDSTVAANYNISDNEFSRFRTYAIRIEHCGENLKINGNRFFQPEGFTPQIEIPINVVSCITVTNSATTYIQNNFFGGSTPAWGAGKFQINDGSAFRFINYEHTSKLAKAVISGNHFGNIQASNPVIDLRLISTWYGNVVIDNNYIGTADSVNSITQGGFFGLIWSTYGTRTFTNNFISSVQGGQFNYHGSSNGSSIVFMGSLDSLLIYNNDIGGSNKPGAIKSTGKLEGINLYLDEARSTIKSNTFRGLQSTSGDVTGISAVSYSPTLVSKSLTIDSNQIHHLLAAATCTGIDSYSNVDGLVQIANNTLYALSSTGTEQGYYGPTGTVNGIIYNKPLYFTGPQEVRIFGNKLHSFDFIRELPNSIFSQTAIAVAAPTSRIYNNEVRFGINTNGGWIDTSTTLTGISIQPSDFQRFLSDHCFIEHNSIYFGGKGSVASAVKAVYDNNYMSPKNLLTITNNIFQIERAKFDQTVAGNQFESIYSINAHSAKNLWYSAAIPNTATILQNFRQTCNCDSSSFLGTPGFINPTGDSSNYNLHLGAVTRADGTGTPPVSNITTDLDNARRADFTPVDIGCYASTPCGAQGFPTITLNTSVDSIQICKGSSTTLKTQLTGGAYQLLQWQKDLQDIPGANTTSLTISDIGDYRLVISNACGKIASNPVNVSVGNLQPSISINTTVNDICEGTTVNFTATAINAGLNTKFQWYINDQVTGTNSSVFSTANIPVGGKVKSVMTTDVCATPTAFTSNIISLTITKSASPAISIMGSTAIRPGESSFINVSTVDGGAIPTYQWQDSTATHTWQTIAGSTNNFMDYYPKATGDKLRCQLTSNANCAKYTTALSNSLSFFINTVTAINSVPSSDLGITIFPNPVFANLKVTGLRLSDRWEKLTVLDLTCRAIAVYDKINGQTELSVPTGKFGAGVYIGILSRSSGKTSYFKFVKM